MALIAPASLVALIVLAGCSKKEEPAASGGTYYTGPMKPKGTSGGGPSQGTGGKAD